MDVELKPCPFCGGKAEIVGGPENWSPTYYDPDSGGDPYSIVCQCGVSVNGAFYDAKEAIETWNRRV